MGVQYGVPQQMCMQHAGTRASGEITAGCRLGVLWYELGGPGLLLGGTGL